ncbi:hypothetical protein IFM89_039498, partial [Coptis chinensis]
FNTKYYYALGVGNTMKRFRFRTLPEVGPDVPYTFGFIGNYEIDFVPEIHLEAPLHYGTPSSKLPRYIIVLSSYSAYGKYTPQDKWLEQEFPKVDRNETPWLIVLMHSPRMTQPQPKYIRAIVKQALVMPRLILRIGPMLTFNRITPSPPQNEWDLQEEDENEGDIEIELEMKGMGRNKWERGCRSSDGDDEWRGHITEGDIVGKAVIVSWVTQDEPGSNTVLCWKANDKQKSSASAEGKERGTVVEEEEDEDSWEMADLDKTMSRLLVSSKTTSVVSTPPSGGVSNNQVDEFLREALQNPGSDYQSIRVLHVNFLQLSLADIPLSLPHGDNNGSVKVAIKQRPGKCSESANNASRSSKWNHAKSVEERKEEYNRARARIFSSENGTKGDNVKAPALLLKVKRG